MEIEEGITAALDGSGIEETPELAVPEKEPDAGNMRMTKNNLLRMPVKLLIKAIYFREGEQRRHPDGSPPAQVPELPPVLPDDPVDDEAATDGEQYKRPLRHQGRCRHEGPGQQVPGRTPVEMIDCPNDQPREIRLGAHVIIGDDQVGG